VNGMKNAKPLFYALVCSFGLAVAPTGVNAEEVKHNSDVKTLKSKHTIKKARNDRMSSLVVSKRNSQLSLSSTGSTVRLVHSMLPNEQTTAQ
jgi:hypothetical protein